MYANGAGLVETYNIVGTSKCAYNNVCYLFSDVFWMDVVFLDFIA